MESFWAVWASILELPGAVWESFRDHSGSIDGIKLGGDFGHRFVTDFGRFRGQFWSHFGTTLGSLFESSFGVISGIVFESILVVLWSQFGPKFEPKGWIDAKRMLFGN